MSATTVPPAELRVFGLGGIPEVRPGDDVAALVGDAIAASGVGLEAGDVVVVTHKIVSKAEGRLVTLAEVEPSALAARFAAEHGKDPRQIEVVLRESRRIVRMDRGIVIAETRHGFVCANAGVDASNVADGVVCLLPDDPDASAARILDGLTRRFAPGNGGRGAWAWDGDEGSSPSPSSVLDPQPSTIPSPVPRSRSPSVIVSDSFGRAWRDGIVNVAIGVAGMAPLADYRGRHDASGYELRASVLAVADELAAAAELVMHKLEARPVALIRGYVAQTDHPPGTGRELVLAAARDMFR